MKTLKAVFFITALFCGCNRCYGMATEDFGPDSQRGRPTFSEWEWPAGIVELPRHPCRVYSFWCNGEECFYFKATPAQINELITLFSKTHIRDHEVWIKTNKPPAQSLDKKPIDYNVKLEITTGIAQFMRRQKDCTDTYDPDLMIYVYGDAAWIQNLAIPDTIILHSDIDGLATKSQKTKPQRTCWHGQIQYKDFPTPEDFLRDATAQITLWQENDPNGFGVAQPGRNGFFDIALSEQEHADLMSEKSHLTVTVGNLLTQAKTDDPVFPVTMLFPKKELVKPVTVDRLEFYYGRILFEDGSPPVLDPLPWPGAKIYIDFPYTYKPDIDEQGFFKVYFTDEQFGKLKAEKPRKNVYIPIFTRKDCSTAEHFFPVSILSRDKDNPGVLKIPRPEIPLKTKHED